MSIPVDGVFILAACALAAVTGLYLGGGVLERLASVERRKELRRTARARGEAEENQAGIAGLIAGYMTTLSRALDSGKASCLSAQARRARGEDGGSRSGFGVGRSSAATQGIRARARGKQGGMGGPAWFETQAEKAGLAGLVTGIGFGEARVRLALGGVALGGVLGAVFSNELCVLLGVCGGIAGWWAPRWAVRSLQRQRTAQIERHLSEMLEVVALGLRSGLSFDRSFELYGMHFDSSLSRACVSAQRRWSLGLSTREEALHSLANSYGSEQFVRVVDNMVRSLRFGSSLAQSLESSAVQARADHKARMEEVVAKAPVKMMLPTGALILPAMLLLVLGPVLLELGEGF